MGWKWLGIWLTISPTKGSLLPTPQGNDVQEPASQSEPEEDLIEDSKEELEREPEGKEELEKYVPIENVTRMEEDEPIESPQPISYYLDS